MKKTVVKFGGSSLADSNQIIKVKDIISSSESRKYCVVSAAGKRNSADDKITDLLISLYKNRDDKSKQEEIFTKIKDRFDGIVSDLNIDFDVDKELTEMVATSKSKNTVDYLASRGEYFSAKILSIYMNAKFLDMQNVITFDDNKKVNYELTYENISREINRIEKDFPDKKIIMPGFYGSTRDGEVVTFSRGGSDITGALVARAINADLYENWTDVSGVLFEDPRLVENPAIIDYITYTELREMSYMGASVLHEETVYPVSKVGIPINILNTNRPTDKGTMIVSSIPSIIKRRTVTGIAGRKGFTSILLQKALMNEEIGFLARLLNIFDKEKISVEHCPTGIDTISVVVRSELLNEKRQEILDQIKKDLNPDVLSVEDNISIIAIVGEGMVYSNDVTAEVFAILRDAKVAVKMIDQGSSGINIIIGVSDNDYEKAMKSLSKLQSINN